MAKGVKTGGGSRLGKPNKVTADMRARIALIIEGQADQFLKKLKAIKDPKQYCDVYLKLAEFNLPKLAKVEQVIIPRRELKDFTDDEIFQLLTDRNTKRQQQDADRGPAAEPTQH